MNEWFIGILGHDLRNPLGAILMSATVLARKVTDDGTGRTVRRILSAGERMNRMIAQLVDFARVRASGGLAIEPKRSDAAAVFRLAVDQSAATQRDREVRFEHHGDTCGFWDGERLAQVAANLVGNAFRHGAPERAVEVQVMGTDAERVSIAVRNGGTIPGELLPRVFEPFQSADVRARRTALGLGLFITREIVASHRGNLMVDSAGDATTFTVTLPRGTAPARTDGSGEPAGTGAARSDGSAAAADP
jgi:signal transduction histidine kinase